VSNDEPSPTDEDVSEFGNDEDVESREISEPEDDDDYNSDEDSKRPKKAPSKSRSVKTTATKSGGGELWRPGVKTGLAPGTQVVIKKPTARSAGKTPYTDRTIHPNTLLFLQDLKANNDRQWLKSKFTFHPRLTVEERGQEFTDATEHNASRCLLLHFASFLRTTTVISSSHLTTHGKARCDADFWQLAREAALTRISA